MSSHSILTLIRYDDRCGKLEMTLVRSHCTVSCCVFSFFFTCYFLSSHNLRKLTFIIFRAKKRLNISCRLRLIPSISLLTSGAPQIHQRPCHCQHFLQDCLYQLHISFYLLFRTFFLHLPSPPRTPSFIICRR